MTEKFTPTDEQRKTVRAMSAYGIPQDDIAKVIEIDAKTLRLHFRDELDRAAIEANTRVAQTCYQMAISGQHPAATFFWLKTRAHWRETARLEHTGADGGPVSYVVRAPPSVDSTEEWLRLYAPKDLPGVAVIDGEAEPATPAAIPPPPVAADPPTAPATATDAWLEEHTPRRGDYR